MELNRQINEMDNKINSSYRHLKSLKTLQATQNRSPQFHFESNSMNNDDGLIAKSNLHSNQDDKKLWSNYECHYWRLHYIADLRATYRGHVGSNKHHTPIISNQTKENIHFIIMLNIFPKYNSNYFI